MQPTKHNWKRIMTKDNRTIKEKQKELEKKRREFEKGIRKIGEAPSGHEIYRILRLVHGMDSLNYEIGKLLRRQSGSVIEWIKDLKS